MKINIKNAQMIPNAGDVFVLGDSANLFVFRGDDARQLKMEYDQQLGSAGGKFKMELQINVEFEEPIGEILR